jgi:pSer/pThr/pTyr-binding forkhead associated (FHA) protein
VELGRLTGILGVVCRACDAYNDPGAERCAGCGRPLSAPSAAEVAPAATPSPPPGSPPPPGAPLVRSFQKPSGGAATRLVPTVLRPSAIAGPPAPEQPVLTPAPPARTCPRCGAEARSGRFCAQCGQALVAGRTQVLAKPPAWPRGEKAGDAGRRALRLVLEGGAGSKGATFPLYAESVAAGRSEGAIRFPDDPSLAPHHATFFYRAGALHVRDVGAPGGIHLRLRGLPVPLRAGDPFVVGSRLLRYAGPLAPAEADPPDGTRRLGAPRPAPPAVVLEECLEGGAVGRVFVRSGPSVTIGRAGCAVNLGDDPHVSQAHAELVLDADGTARLRDLGSSNGTYVKVPAHAERELRDGDFVRMGHEVLRVAVGRE